MPIYTRTGDKGKTSLFGGKRVLKCDELVDAYGSIDEVNSRIGLLIAEVKIRRFSELLQTYQEDLFTIGSSLAGWKTDLDFLDARVEEMEKEIDKLEKELPELNNFILPGGSKTGANIHITRSIARKVERQLVALSRKQKVDPLIIKYFNRLSDLFFDMARYINMKENGKEITWSGMRKK